ncbi:MAG: hypothetical protein JYX80_04220 [Candidatus Scalindua sediminis]|nr:hypothetical protein [Candidatus Scalindua sediminis]
MSLKTGTYSLNGDFGNVYVYTFKEGLLSKLAHDLLIDVTNFKVNLIYRKLALLQEVWKWSYRQIL